ncbi:glucan endo-1,3-beta-glucosidase 5 [Gossypium hirsutum]|uniref:glucan endo-1,3-beta-D-glucosidase n=1 Tax=Gossypium hirsutum TaxID=3635 RepID=A0ABM2YW23_GOSHI|nr:glucan endo-1,3-beta-glucosidase 5-like [Gossypium hirsutum]
MLQAQVFLWAYILLFFPASIVAQGLGVNWGVIASHPLDPKIVVNMLKDNGIKKVKLFHAEHDILTALSGTDIEVMVGIPNHSLESLSEKYSVAQAWVKANITAYMGKKGVNFKYVAVGNEPFLAAYNGTYNDLTLPAMKNILKALNEAGVGKDIKVSTPLNGDVYITPTYKPSDGIFRHDLADIMNGICEFLHKNNAAFIVNIYPFLNLYQNPGFPEPYAFFDNDDSNSMDDHGVKYCSV